MKYRAENNKRDSLFSAFTLSLGAIEGQNVIASLDSVAATRLER